MKPTKLFPIVLVLLCLLPAGTGFAGGASEGRGGGGRGPSAAEKGSDALAQSIDSRLVEANTRFGFALLRHLAAEQRGQNLFVSPLSILLALAMTYQGAVEDTRLAMGQALEFSGFTTEALNRGFRDLTASVVEADREADIRIANSIWWRRGYEVGKAFIETNRRYYGAEARELDLADPKSAQTINRWIDRATNGKIDRMLEEMPPDMVMYLVNAIYFKGDWTHPFPEGQTREGEFTPARGGGRSVPMMHLRERLRHARGDDLGMLKLPYGRDRLAMYILLPDRGVDLEEILAVLDEETWKRLSSRLEPAEVALAMPRFKLEYRKQLREVLSRMGMGIAFEPRGGLAGINPEVFISEVDHRAVIEVNEKGSEAAAVTVVGVTKAAPLEPVEFTVDRPFFFAIADERTGSILFMGAVAEP